MAFEGRIDNRQINAFLTTTFGEFEPVLQDQIFIEEPLSSWFNGNLATVARKKGSTPKKTKGGGERILEPLMYGDNDTFNSYAGSDVINTELQDGMTNAAFDWSEYAGTVGITMKQKMANRGPHALINLLDAKVKQLQLSAAQRINIDLWSSTVGNNGLNLSGMPKQVSDTIATGGLTVTDIDARWKSIHPAPVGSFATNGITAMDNIINSLKIQGSIPDIIMTTQLIYELYKNDQVDQKRYANTLVLDAGFTNVTYNEIPIVFDSRATSGVMYFLNGMFMHWVVMNGLDFNMDGDFRTPDNQTVSMTKILLMANTTISNRRKQGFLTGITA